MSKNRFRIVPTETAPPARAAGSSPDCSGEAALPSGPRPAAAQGPSAPPRGKLKLARERGPGKRLTDYRRDAEEGHMNEEQLEFIQAIDEYKRSNHRPFPTWTEILDIMLYIGYRKVAPVGEFKLMRGRETPRKDTEDGSEES